MAINPQILVKFFLQYLFFLLLAHEGEKFNVDNKQGGEAMIICSCTIQKFTKGSYLFFRHKITGKDVRFHVYSLASCV